MLKGVPDLLFLLVNYVFVVTLKGLGSIKGLFDPRRITPLSGRIEIEI